MAALEADKLNSEFFKNFLPETIYLVPVEEALFTSPEDPAPVGAPVVENQPVVREQEPAPAPAPVVKPAATPAIPKLPKLEAPVAKPSIYDSIGSNAKGLVVLVTLPDATFRALPQSDFLQKILHAIGFRIEDVLFVNNISGKVVVFEELVAAYEVNYIISFASRLDTALPHDKFTLYKPVVVGEVPVVFSQSLEVLDKDQEHKKHLWGALKQVFL